MMKTVLRFLVMAVLLATIIGVAAAEGEQITARLVPIDGSGVTGRATLGQLANGETRIEVVARGLVPGTEYVSLYYDNHTCELEPYEEDDVIGGTYTANREGIGQTRGEADDALEEINSVSVRRESDFALLACADIHPGE
jgi:hypothetical protein